MFNPLKGLGDIHKLQKMQQELQKQEVTKIKEIQVDGEKDNRITDAINEAVKKTQEQAARTLMSMSQDDKE